MLEIETGYDRKYLDPVSVKAVEKDRGTLDTSMERTRYRLHHTETYKYSGASRGPGGPAQTGDSTVRN
jgi:hypothetical protein